jgi:hypothetical protein
VTDIEVSTGEIVAGSARMTGAEVLAEVEWIRDQLRTALVPRVDYDTLPRTARPTLLKPGAEKLLMAARYSSACEQVDDDDARQHRGVRYLCTITDRDGRMIAVRDAYAGYDEVRFANHTGWRADWNNVCQMAQKRATVAATKVALNASGIFADEPDPGLAVAGGAPAPGAGPRRARPTAPRGRAERVPDYVYDEAPEAGGSGSSGSAGRGEAGPAGPDPERPF